MSRTLFFYIFRDLVRIFFLTSGALAGIMSFGGLLRPLTEHGLDASQAAKMLSYFMPAMTTYSLPIAALFATTMVYGRLAADNELTACRAAGISYISIGFPAMVLGLTVALVSLLFLCFIVPVFTLKVEHVIYSNLARMISSEIERKHSIKFQDTTIFAQEAAVAPTDPRHPEEQHVSLAGLMIVSYRKAPLIPPDTQDMWIPKEFYLAKQATVVIHRAENGEFTLEANLEAPGGAMFPRSFSAGQVTQGGLATTHYGPVAIPSPVKEDTKFMDIRRLQELYRDVTQSRRMQEQLQKILRAAQEAQYLREIARAASRPNGTFHFDAGAEQYDLISPGGRVEMKSGKLIVTPARLTETRDGRPVFNWNAAEIALSASPVAGDVLSVQAQLRDVIAETPEGPTARPSFTRSLVVKMPPELKEMEDRKLEYFHTAPGVAKEELLNLQRLELKLINGIQSEMHSRASFAVSCLILVIVGCCLGMMFKSGNFLSAFALSVVPALLTIALIVAGRQTCENIPWKLDHFHNPLTLGLLMIWSGNILVAVIGTVLGWNLQRQ